MKNNFIKIMCIFIIFCIILLENCSLVDAIGDTWTTSSEEFNKIVHDVYNTGNLKTLPYCDVIPGFIYSHVQTEEAGNGSNMNYNITAQDIYNSNIEVEDFAYKNDNSEDEAGRNVQYLFKENSDVTEEQAMIAIIKSTGEEVITKTDLYKSLDRRKMSPKELEYLNYMKWNAGIIVMKRYFVDRCSDVTNLNDSLSSETNPAKEFYNAPQGMGLQTITCGQAQKFIDQLNKSLDGTAKSIETEMGKFEAENPGHYLIQKNEDLKNEVNDKNNQVSQKYEEYKQYYEIEFTNTTFTGDKPEFSLEKLTNRVKNLLGQGEQTQFSEAITGIIIGDGSIADIIGKIGRYIIYACIIFFGVRAIWGGVEGKTQFKEVIPYLLIGIVFFFCAEKLIEIATSAFSAGQKYEGNGVISGTEIDYEEYGQDLFKTIIYIVRVLAFAGIAFTGIKLLFAAPEKKADIKSSMLSILIGCIFVFASSLIVEIVVGVFDNAKKVRI